ncbi:MAG: oligosaccharide flippase family protein [bacterium]
MALAKLYLEHKSTIHNLGWRILQITSQQGMVLFLFILCARFLSPIEFGFYNYTLAIVLFLVMFGDFGISSATSKYVAEYNVTNKEKLRAIPFNAGITVFGFGLLTSIIVLIFGSLYLGNHFESVLYVLPLVFLTPLVSLYDGIYRGLRRFRSLTLISAVIACLFVPLAYFLVKTQGLLGALLAQDVFYFVLLAGLVIGYRDFAFKINWKVIKMILKYSVIVGIGSVGFFFFGKIDTIFLGSFGYIKDIGYIEILNRLFSIVGTLPLIIASVIGPTIAGIHSRKEHKLLLIKLNKYIVLSLIIALIGSLAFLFFGKYVIQFAFPQYYDQTMINIIPLYSLLLFSYLCASIVPSGFAVYTGHAKISAYFLIGFGILHVILNYVFLSAFGFYGLIFSILLTRIPSDLLFIFFYKTILSREQTAETAAY